MHTSVPDLLFKVQEPVWLPGNETVVVTLNKGQTNSRHMRTSIILS